MSTPPIHSAIDYAAVDDLTLAGLVDQGDRQAFRFVMRSCNQRLFRVARSILGNDAEAEDAVQESYVRAYERIASFRGEASLLTWLTRIVTNEAYGRIRGQRRTVGIDHIDIAQQDSAVVLAFPGRFGSEDPAASAMRDQARRLIERAIDELPVAFRAVFVMRDVESCTIEETAIQLGIRPETVKTRLHRARRLLRAALNESLSAMLGDAFPFLGVRCDRIIDRVLARVGNTNH